MKQMICHTILEIQQVFEDLIAMIAQLDIPLGSHIPDGCLLVSLVPMLEQKTTTKSTFFQAGQCAALSSFRV